MNGECATFDCVFETFAIHKFHENEKLLAGFLKVVKRRNMRMMQIRLQSSFI